ncbi:MAG: hypothetical protein ACRDU8_04810 [Egibacteraceae bacterium]
MVVAASGGLFVGGAVGVEVVARPFYALPSESSLGYALLVLLEEGMELAGLVLFVWALLLGLRDALEGREVAFTR